MTPVLKFPTNYEWNNYIWTCRLSSTVSGLNFPHITSCPAKQQNTFHTSPALWGIREGNSTKTRLAFSSSSFSDWYAGEVGPWPTPDLRKLLWPRWDFGRKPDLAQRCIGGAAAFSDPKDLLVGLPPLAIYSHTHVAPARWIGLPLGSNGCFCFASSPLFSSQEPEERPTH